MYHLGKNTGTDWIAGLYLIRYVYFGSSRDWPICGIPEVNFCLSASQFRYRQVSNISRN